MNLHEPIITFSRWQKTKISLNEATREESGIVYLDAINALARRTFLGAFTDNQSNAVQFCEHVNHENNRTKSDTDLSVACLSLH